MSFAGKVLRLCGVRLGVLRQHAPRPLVLEAGPVPAPSSGLSIGLVTPVYNGERFIERTIQSVLSQGYPRLQYVVQDGGSTDGTMACIARYADRLARVVSEPDRGQADAINRGFAALPADVDVMGWLNADDLLLPGALARIAAFFDSHPDVDVVYGHRILVDEDDREIGRWVLPPHDDRVLSWRDYVPQESLYWRRRAWTAIGGALDDSFQFAMDWDLLLRLRAGGARMARLPAFLGAFRIHETQKTSAQIGSVGFAEMQRLWVRTLGREPSALNVSFAVLPYLLRHLLAHWRYRSTGAA